MEKAATRNFEVNYYEKEGEKNVWTVESHLSDEPHDITVTVEIDMDSMVIRDAKIKFDRYPVEKCPLIEQKAKKLIGLKVDRSFSRNVMSIFLTPQGCPNIMTLLNIAVPGIIYYYYPYQIKKGRMTQQEFWNIMREKEKNACLAHTLIFAEK